MKDMLKNIMGVQKINGNKSYILSKNIFSYIDYN